MTDIVEMDSHAVILMSARKGQPNAVLEQVAQIPLVLSAVSALRDTKVMGKIATMMMSALVVSIVI